MSSPRERTDREELLKKKKRERERERVRTYSPSQKQKRKKRSDCLVFKVCVCVCCACEFSEESQTFRIISNERRRKSGRYFLPVCTFEI